MALNYITLVLDLAEGTGPRRAAGQVEDAEYEPVMLFINHSCEPNVGFADNTVLVAMRDISPGEGPTTDYALFDDYDGMMQCRCGTPSCRATIGGQDLRGFHPGSGAPVHGVTPRPAVEDRVRVRVDRLWRQAAPAASTRPRTGYFEGGSADRADRPDL